MWGEKEEKEGMQEWGSEDHSEEAFPSSTPHRLQHP